MSTKNMEQTVGRRHLSCLYHARVHRQKRDLMSLSAPNTVRCSRRPLIAAVVTKSALVTAALAMAALLVAGCSSSGSSGPGNSAVSRVYGPGAYQLRGERRGYSAEIIVKQIKNGIVVLAAGGSYRMSTHLRVPGFRFAFYENGRKQLTWTTPTSSDCRVSYASGYHPVCLSAAHIPAGKTPRTDLIGRCSHPVFLPDTGTEVKLIAENKVNGLRYTVKSVGILLLSRRGAGAEQ
jgi:hypothetical protein